MIIRNYNIHDLLTFKLLQARPCGFRNGLNLPFSFFEVEKGVDCPDISLNVGRFDPANQGCYLIDHKYYVKPGYFYCEDAEGTVAWTLEMSDFEEGKTIVNFDMRSWAPESILAGAFLPQEMIVKFLLGYKLAQRGYLLLHAAGVAQDNRAYIFVGRGGAFKSHIAVDLVKKAGFRCLGDDWIIIHDNQALSFPVPVHPLGFTLSAGRMSTERSSTLWDKLLFLRYLRTATDWHLLPIQKWADLNAICVVSKSSASSVTVRNATEEHLARRLVANNLMEAMTTPVILGRQFGRFYRYALAYSFAFPNGNLARYWQDLEQQLQQVVGQVPVFDIQLPQEYVFGRFYEALERMEREIG